MAQVGRWLIVLLVGLLVVVGYALLGRVARETVASMGDLSGSWFVYAPVVMHSSSLPTPMPTVPPDGKASCLGGGIICIT